jgi:predicted nucleic acid-binding protein
VVTPTFADWREASEIVAAIEEKSRPWRSKLPLLLNDILIALCARRVGATLLTYNREDFLLIHRHYDFSLRILAT